MRSLPFRAAALLALACLLHAVSALQRLTINYAASSSAREGHTTLFYPDGVAPGASPPEHATSLPAPSTERARSISSHAGAKVPLVLQLAGYCLTGSSQDVMQLDLTAMVDTHKFAYIELGALPAIRAWPREGAA